MPLCSVKTRAPAGPDICVEEDHQPTTGANVSDAGHHVIHSANHGGEMVLLLLVVVPGRLAGVWPGRRHLG